MIGATGSAPPAPSALPQSPPTQVDAPTATVPADSANAPEAASAETAGREAAARPAPARATGPAREGAPPASVQEDFAALLLASADASAVATAPTNVTTASTNDRSGDVAGSDTGSLPGQLLALLEGAWLKPSSPIDPAATPALPAAQPANPAAAVAIPTGITAAIADGKPVPDFAALALASQTAVPAAMADAGTGAVDASFADALATATTSDTNGAVSAFPALATSPASAPAARAMMAAPVSVPADPQAGFDDGFGARLVWMAEQRLGHAEIRLNPEHLGPIEVRIQVDGTQVSAEFQSGHAGVRQAIEASLPRLRDLLGQQGLQLGQADVGQRHAGSGQPAREGADGHPAPASSGSAVSGMSTRLRSRGLLDEYA